MDRYLKLIKREWANISFVKNTGVHLPYPLVSFTFDDAPSSAFENGGNILSNYGFRGTFYIALSLMHNANVRFTFEQLKEAVSQSHELGCHTFNHIDLSQTKLTQSITDIEHNQEAMQELFPGIEFKNFSYPFGAQTRGIKKYLSGRFRSARGIGHGINVGRTDLCNLKAVKLYENKRSLEQTFAAIHEAAESKGWLIFYTHDVAHNPSKHGCSPAYFEAVVKECANRGIRVVTVNEALNLIENQAILQNQISYPFAK